MNIFEVLSRGKSRLNEPSISAMLGYLLSPHDDHGLNDIFLRSFLALIEKKIGQNVFPELLAHKKIQATVSLEEPYTLNDSRKDIDIQISLYDTSLTKELHRIIIENKIKPGAANLYQLRDYYNAVIFDEDYQAESPILTIVFITPHSQYAKLTEEYELFLANKDDSTYASWIYWQSEDEHEETIITLVRNILRQELQAEINPINEYMRQTLKAFVCHLSNMMDVGTKPRTQRRGKDIGDLLEESALILKSGHSYRIIRRDSGQIQLYDLSTEEKVKARPVLYEYALEKGLIKPGEQRHTRDYGEIIFQYLHGQRE
jgi:hypothetical protein